MSRRDDVSRLYKISKILDIIEKIFFVLNIIAAVVTLADNDRVVFISSVIQMISAILYFIINVINDGYFWYEAEKNRRNNCIQDGFGTRLSEFETEEYYNNQSKESLEKYSLNILESNLFSKVIAGKMILWSCIKSFISIIILAVACRFLSDSNLLLIIAQTVFSSYVIMETVQLVFYKIRMDNIYSYGYTALITPGIKGKGRTAVLFSYSVEYEAIKAHYKIRLDENIFEKNNEKLSEQWKKILSHKVL